MKLNRAFGVLLVLLLGSVFQVFGQPNEAERKQFDAIKDRADKGDAEAQLSVAFCYANGTGVSRDAGKAVKWLRKAAEQGLPRAQCLLGLRYASGEGVKPDKFEAARWLQRAADQDLPEAQFDLGMCYANGEGVQRSVVDAIAWYRKAAEQDLPDAQCELGNCYLEGNGVPKEVPEGVKWTRKAAEQGFARAQNALGLCYFKGTGVPKDNVQAYKWFNLAAATGGELADDARVNLAAAQRYLTPEQVAEAQRLASEFKPHKGPAAKDVSAPSSTTNSQTSASRPGTTGTASASAAPGRAENTGVVNVKAQDDSFEIFVDGAFVGNTPAKVMLPEGSHVVEVKRAGYKDYRRQLKVTRGSELTLSAVLEKQ
jgi:TPR repeat protein